jgi:RNA polymerase sigma-70 factor (ECF subfamily)
MGISMKDPRGDRKRKTLGAAPGDDGSAQTGPAAGEVAAFDSLVRAHYDGVWRLVHRIVRRERESEVVVQQVFLEARAAPAGHRDGPSLAAWLRRLAVQHAARAVKPGRSRRPKLDGGPLGQPPERRRALPALHPERDRRILEESLACLEGAQRAALALHLEGLGYAEIARDLGLPIGAVQNRLAVAREYLSRAVEARRATDER